jgi:Protein of unknown function (DUF1353)
MRRVSCLFALMVSFAAPILGQSPPAQPPNQYSAPSIVPSLGKYVGVVKVQWDDDGRDMTLLEDYSYVDPAGLTWLAPKGLKTDGASIPQVAWTIIGGPFEGTYRYAAVIHDAACDRKDRSWEATHEMFYQAMLTSHVAEEKAKIMYAAVYHFGPRWELTRVVTNILQTDLAAAVASIQSTTHAVNSEAHVASNTPTDLHTKQDFTVQFVPTPKTFTQADFDSLKTMIEQQETAKPGSVTLEEIRNYQPTKPITP